MGRYEWKQRIATGGMGEVWRAEDTVLGREVAVKVLKPELADDPRLRERFANEARNAASLHHPHIASVFDFGESAGDPPRPYLVMELVRGRPLSDLLQSGRAMPADRARDIVTQTAGALAAAHRVGMVHRDVKPGNILITPDRQVKVTDFGIARAADAAALTGTGEVLGTPHYLSPEQAEGKAATPASDVYSLGVVLFELLSGRRPFSADTAVATALAHVREPMPDLPGGLPSDLVEITRRALSKDPAQRFPDGAAFARALSDPSAIAAPVASAPQTDATQVLRPVSADPPTRVAPALPAFDDDPWDDPRRNEPAEPRAKRDTNWLLLAIPAVILVLVVIFLVVRNTGQDTRTPTDRPSSDSSSASATGELDADDYVGSPVGDAEDRLLDRGFSNFTTRTQDNPGDETAGDVSAISPVGTVPLDSTITLTTWGDPPEQQPSQEPSQEPSPSSSPSPTPTASPTQSPSASASGGQS